MFFRGRFGFGCFTLGEKLMCEVVGFGVDGFCVVCGESCKVRGDVLSTG